MEEQRRYTHAPHSHFASAAVVHPEDPVHRGTTGGDFPAEFCSASTTTVDRVEDGLELLRAQDFDVVLVESAARAIALVRPVYWKSCSKPSPARRWCFGLPRRPPPRWFACFGWARSTCTHTAMPPACCISGREFQMGAGSQRWLPPNPTPGAGFLDRRKPSHAADRSANPPGGSAPLHRPDHRRNRNRQGIGGPFHPRLQRTQPFPSGGRELQRASRSSARSRAVRTRQGRIHGRSQPPHRALRGGQSRHHFPGRNWRPAVRSASQAAARASGARVPAAGQLGNHPRGRAGDRRHQRRSGGIDQTRQVPRRFVLPAQRGADR